MQKKYYIGIGGILIALVGLILGPTLLLLAIGQNDRITDSIDTQEVDSSFEHRNPAAPVRNAREKKIFQLHPRDKVYTQTLPFNETKNVPWNFYTTEKWPIPSTYSDFGSRTILLAFNRHGNLAMDVSYIGVQGPQSNVYPAFDTLAGEVVALSDNETTTYFGFGGSYPNKLTDTCDKPSPEETPWGPYGKTVNSATGNPYGSYISERNSRWLCLNYSDIYKRGSRYWSDKMRPAPDWKNWQCDVVDAYSPSAYCVENTATKNPCGDCELHPYSKDCGWEGPPTNRKWVCHETPASCSEKPMCEPVPAQSECIMGHGEFKDPLNELAGTAMMKVPDYEILTSHFAGGNRASDAAMDGSLGKMMVSSKAGKSSIKSMLYFIIGPNDAPFFTDAIANLGTDGSSDWPSDTLLPMVHYEVFRNINVCEPMTRIDMPVTLTSMDPYTVTQNYVEIDPLDYSPCKLPPPPPSGYIGHDFICDLVFLYDGLPANNNNGRGGYHGDQYNNAYDLGVRPNDGPDEPPIVQFSSIVADTEYWVFPQGDFVHNGYTQSEF